MSVLRLSTAQLSAQCVKVGVRSVVLQLTSDLGLLGLSSAAPHGSTPSPGQFRNRRCLTNSWLAGYYLVLSDSVLADAKSQSYARSRILRAYLIRESLASAISPKTTPRGDRLASGAQNLLTSANGANGLLLPTFAVTLTVMTAEVNDSEPLLTPAEVAAMFRVDPKTVTRWAKAGKLSSVRTLGGHRRYLASEVRALLDGGPAKREEVPPPPPTMTRVVTSLDATGLEPLPPPPPTSGSSAGLPSR